MDIKEQVILQAMKAKQASLNLSNLSTDLKNKALEAMACALEQNAKEILFRNEIDVTAAKQINLSPALIDRLLLTEKRIKNMAASIRNVIKLDDPINETIDEIKRPNGLIIKKVRVPIGVIGIIYESRPNVTSEAISLCIKAGNTIILRGGKEAYNSNHILAQILSNAAYKAGLPEGSIQFFEIITRQAIDHLLVLDNLIDLIIPRGGAKMISEISAKSKIPVLKHDRGLCHTYVDKNANLKMAEAIALNAKISRPSVCNAMETLLVHQDIAEKFLPGIMKKFQEADVEIRGCEKTIDIVKDSTIKPASEKDWNTEYLDLILSVKVINNLDEAIEHINKYGSKHSEAIVTEDKKSAEIFLQQVDAAAVYANASTRFTDGGEFGMGAEMGISTQKIHARGPVGLRELTSYKYIVYGTGQIRN